MEGLKPQIRNKIGVQVMRNLHEAKNMALKAKFILQDRGRYEPSKRNFGGENSRAPVDKGVTVQEVQPRNDRFREEKATGKQKVVETKEVPKATNPYARLAPVKYFKCNQPSHRSSDCPLRRVVHLAKWEEEDDNEVCCEPDGYGEDKEDNEEDDHGHNYVVRKLMLTLKQEESIQLH